MNSQRQLISFLFFLSGAAGLIYQLLWIRKFTYLLGSAYLTVSIIVTVFMGGLLMGGWLIGRYIDRAKNPIRWYGFLEIFIGIYALFFITAFHLFDLLFGGISSAFQNIEGLRISFTALLILIILLPPTCAMGATLPLLVQHFTKKFSDFKINISLFYAINTLGAALGVLIAGFFLIEKTGITNGILLTGGFNILIGIGAFALSKQREEILDQGSAASRQARRDQPLKANVQTKSKKGSKLEQGSSPARREQEGLVVSKIISKKASLQTFLLVTAFLSGFIALSYEIIWTRALKFLIQSSTYSFTIILFVFLLGIAIGSRIAERWMKENSNFMNRYGQLQLFLAVTSLFTIWFLYRLAYTDFLQQKIFDVIFDYSFGWFSGIIVYAFVCGIVFLLSTILMGVLFPLLNEIFFASGEKTPGKSVSKIYVINTAGSIVGALAAGFILIPLIGIKWSIVALSVINLLIGLVFIFKSGEKSFLGIGISFLLFLFILFQSTSGNFLKSKEELNSESVKFYDEGLAATVKVYEAKNSLNMSIDGMNIASTSPALMQKELLIAHLPFFIHPEIHDVLSVGLASGVSTGSIAQHSSVKKVDCVELIQPVFEAASYFDGYNHDVIHDPKVNFIHSDIYAFLKFNDTHYDLISSDGKLGTLDNANTTMLSSDYYDQCKRDLNPGGIFIQWIPLITPSSCFNVILQTLKKSFDHVSIFYFYPSDVFMIASDAPLQLDLGTMIQGVREEPVKKELASIGISKASEVMCSYIGNYENANAHPQINTMNQPLLEFWFYRDWKKSGDQAGGYRAQNLSYLISNFKRNEKDELNTYEGLPNPALANGIFSSSVNFFEFCVINFTEGNYEAGKKEYEQFKQSIPF